MKMSNSPAKYEVLIKQYLRSILNISERFLITDLMPFLIAAGFATIGKGLKKLRKREQKE